MSNYEYNTEREILEYIDDLSGAEYEDFPKKDRGKKTDRYKKGVNVRNKRRDLLLSKGYDEDLCNQVGYGYKLSELGHPSPWKKYNTTSKRPRHNNDLSGKGNRYKYVNGRGNSFMTEELEED